MTVSIWKSIGKSKVSGTVRGVMLISAKILSIISPYYLVLKMELRQDEIIYIKTDRLNRFNKNSADQQSDYKMRSFYIIFISFLFLQCQDKIPTKGSDPEEIINNNDQITIVDRTGKEWDITDAVQKFGFQPSKFQFGLGPNAIKPIIHPDFFHPGDPGHPSPSHSSIVIGTTINNDTRAYPLFILKSHEIVDDSFGDTHVAVAY